jgi:protein-S-isoprenylcysteine O-methyltransferase Ste14
VNNTGYLLNHADSITTHFLEVFNAAGFWFLFQVIVFVDVLFFTVGYLIEHPRLNNQIRSVDPTWLGWAVALACYPPMNDVTASILGWNSEEFPQFESPSVHLALNFLLLGLMAIYASASVALNFKASNLTHRGIISHGPYRYVRHPAYVCKNLAWWIGTIPALLIAWQQSAWTTLMIVGSMAAWTGIYALRALTEEDHLRSVNDEYDAYCRKVRYRFIPGVY